MTYLALALAALLLLLARTVVHWLAPALAWLVMLRWLLRTQEGARGLGFLDAAALLTLWIYPVNVFDIAALALALWAALH